MRDVPAATLHAPTVPGVTAPPSFAAKRLPAVLEALKLPKEEDRGKELERIAKDWFDAHQWYYREATTCEAHDAGAQWGFLDDKTNLWVGDTLDADADRIRITANVTKAVNDTATAMLTQDWPIFLPAAGQPGVSAAAAAETSRAFLKHTWRFHDLDDLYRNTARAAFVTGTSFVLVEWDKSIGPLQLLTQQDGVTPVMEPVPAEPAGETSASSPVEGDAVLPAGVDEGGELVPPGEMDGDSNAPGTVPNAADAPMPQTEVPVTPSFSLRPKFAPQGDLRYRMLMRSQVAFDPAARRRGGQDGLGVVLKWREPKARILAIRPDIFDDLPRDDVSGGDETYKREERTQKHSPLSGSSQKEEENDDETLEVCVFYLRSRPDAPRGDCIMVCKGRILYAGENDAYPTYDEMKKGELWPAYNWPVFDFIADARENCPWGRARTVDAIPIQHAINGALSKALQHAAIIANVKYVMPAGLDFAPTDEPGQVARVAQRFWQMTGGDPVRMTQPPQMPPEYLQIVGVGRELLETVVGINAASLGNAPSSQPSGRLTQSLQQRDNTRIAPLKRAHDNQWGRVQEYALRLLRRNATGKRALLVVGEDQQVALRFFEVANLAAGTQIEVVNDNSIPRDPEKRVMFLTNMTTMLAGLPNAELQDLVLDLLHMPDIAEYRQRTSPHHVAAVRMTRLLLLGESDGTPQIPGAPENCPLPAPWDNPLIFKAELERFAQSAEYRDRVKAEKQAASATNPANPAAAVSPLEQRFVWVWSYYAERAIAAVPPAMPAQPGAPGSSNGPPSDTSGQGPKETSAPLAQAA